MQRPGTKAQAGRAARVARGPHACLLAKKGGGKQRLTSAGKERSACLCSACMCAYRGQHALQHMGPLLHSMQQHLHLRDGTLLPHLNAPAREPWRGEDTVCCTTLAGMARTTTAACIDPGRHARLHGCGLRQRMLPILLACIQRARARQQPPAPPPRYPPAPLPRPVPS